MRWTLLFVVALGLFLVSNARADVAAERAKLKTRAELFKEGAAKCTTAAGKAAPEGLTAEQKETWDKETVLLRDWAKEMSTLSVAALKVFQDSKASAEAIGQMNQQLQQEMQRIQNSFEASSKQMQRADEIRRSVQNNWP